MFQQLRASIELNNLTLLLSTGVTQKKPKVQVDWSPCILLIVVDTPHLHVVMITGEYIFTGRLTFCVLHIDVGSCISLTCISLISFTMLMTFLFIFLSASAYFINDSSCFLHVSEIVKVWSVILQAAYMGWRGHVWYRVSDVPRMLFCVLPKRSIPKPDQHRKDIIQQESQQQLHKISH